MPVTVPPSLLIVLEVLRPCFTAPSFATMSALVTGALSAAASPRTVTGMWQAAGLAGRCTGRAHRFFSRAVGIWARWVSRWRARSWPGSCPWAVR